ncbi:hypothetical protein HHI36_022180, partial [Cryptolaemus montrouzieri]
TKSNIQPTKSKEQRKTKYMKQISKFEEHKKQTPSIKPQPSKTTEIQIVHSLSKIALNDSAVSALSKGFNYAIAPNKIPLDEIICGVEPAIKTLT